MKIESVAQIFFTRACLKMTSLFVKLHIENLTIALLNVKPFEHKFTTFQVVLMKTVLTTCAYTCLFNKQEAFQKFFLFDQLRLKLAEIWFAFMHELIYWSFIQKLCLRKLF